MRIHPLLMLLVLSLNTQLSFGKKTCHITIFIHGTTFFDISSKEEGTSILKALREEIYPMQGTGLVEVPSKQKDPLTPSTRHKSVFHVVRTFHNIRTTSHQAPATTYKYYTFGWSGLLSEQERKNSADEFYHALTKVYQQESAQGATVTFELHGHSHGGQLILLLPKICAEHKNTSLHVKLAVLWGTPLFYENVRNVLSGMFDTIINMYSDGDRTQAADIFSTPQHHCHKTFAEIGLPLPSGNAPAPHIIDVRLLINNYRNFIGHHHFFVLDRYPMPGDHIRGKTLRSIVRKIRPFPLVVLFPAYFESIETLLAKNNCTGYCHIDADLEQSENNLQVCSTLVGTCTHKSTTTSLQIPQSLKQDNAITKEAYRDTSQILIRCKK